jgi:serine/threonine protein kinase
VLLTKAGDAKVSDFGIAKSIDDDQTTGVLLGTAAYVAPERLLGERATPASDLYGVGVVMYEALSGRKPFVADSPLGVVRAVQQGKAAPFDDVDAPDLRAVVERAMAKDPSRRYPSARDMEHALEAPMEDPDATVPVHAPRAATQTMTLPRPPVPGRGKPARRAGRSPRPHAPSRRALVVAALAVVLVICAVLAVVSMSGGDGRVPITSSSASSGSQATATTSTPTPGVSLPPRLEHALDALEKAVRR